VSSLITISIFMMMLLMLMIGQIDYKFPWQVSHVVIAWKNKLTGDIYIYIYLTVGSAPWFSQSWIPIP